MSGADETARREWREGAPLVATAAACLACGTVPVYMLGPLLIPLSEEFGWSRGAISSGLFISTLCALVFGPLVGGFIDRMGVRKAALWCSAWFCLCIAAFGLTGPGIATWIAVWVVYSVVKIPMVSGLWVKAVSSRFERGRGLALALTLSGSGVMSSIAPLFITNVSEAIGWRGALFLMALAVFCILMPLIWFGIFEARDIADRKGAPVAAKAAVVQAAPQGMSLFAAMKLRVFWQIGIPLFIVAGAVAMLLVHMQPFLRDAGMTPMRVAQIAAISGPFMIAGRVVVGLLLDRFHAPYVAAGAFLLPVVNCLIVLNFDGSIAMALVLAALVGMCAGAEADVLAYLTAKYFGMANYAKIYGLLAAMYAVGFGGITALGGLVFDITGSYDALMYYLIAGLIGAALLIGTLGSHAKQKAAAAGAGEQPSSAG